VPEILTIKQDPVLQIGELQFSEDEIAAEPYLRRASPEFAHDVGGPITKRFVELADKAGRIQPGSLVRSQRTPFVEGSYPTPPQWHFDFIPGVQPSCYESLNRAIYSNTGLIVCLFDQELHPDDTGTLFLADGEVMLDLDKRDEQNEYVPGKNFADGTKGGHVYWWDPQTRRQIAAGDIATTPLVPGGVYGYASHNMHHVSQMRSSFGSRMLLRMNNPTDPEFIIVPENKAIFPGDDNYPAYVFNAVDPIRWVRRTVLAKAS